MVQPHIQLEEGLNIPYALLPGDPGRLDRISEQLEQVQELAYNREFRSLRGTYRGVPVLAISTGIGGSSAAIAMEELRNVGVKAMIRIGSCGALQKGIPLGTLIFANGAIRDEGTSKAYADVRFPAVPDPVLLGYLMQIAAEEQTPHRVGVVHSHESFYIDTNDQESAYWSGLGALGADMETAALFTVGAIRGIRTASILNNVVECGADTGESIGDYAGGADLCARGEALEIHTALEAFYRLDRSQF